MSNLASLMPHNPLDPGDPASIGWSQTFVLELALRVDTVAAICAAHDITPEMWRRLKTTPAFVKDLQRAHEALKEHGASFRTKAQLQSEALLKRSWEMIHAPHDLVPPNVQADLIKFTIKAAGLDASKDQNANGSGGPSLVIQINTA